MSTEPQAYWRNNVAAPASTKSTIEKMDELWEACRNYAGPPPAIFFGDLWAEAWAREERVDVLALILSIEMGQPGAYVGGTYLRQVLAALWHRKHKRVRRGRRWVLRAWYEPNHNRLESQS